MAAAGYGAIRPTVEDAVFAAQGPHGDDIDGQVEIVMSLMPVSAEEARAPS